MKTSFAVFSTAQTVVKKTTKESSSLGLAVVTKLNDCDVYDKNNWSCTGKWPSGLSWWMSVSEGEEQIDDVEEYRQNRDGKIPVSLFRYGLRWIPGIASRDQKNCVGHLTAGQKTFAELEKRGR